MSQTLPVAPINPHTPHTRVVQGDVNTPTHGPATRIFRPGGGIRPENPVRARARLRGRTDLPPTHGQPKQRPAPVSFGTDRRGLPLHTPPSSRCPFVGTLPTCWWAGEPRSGRQSTGAPGPDP